MVVANKVNLKKNARQLLGADYSQNSERLLLQCTTLNEFNQVLHGFGVEGQYCNVKPDLSFRYVNTGDGYNLTIIEFRGRLHIGCWAEIVEKNMRYFN